MLTEIGEDASLHSPLFAFSALPFEAQTTVALVTFDGNKPASKKGCR